MDIDAYLERIGYHGPRTADAQTLRELHRAHLHTVPFENLDIHLGRPIVLDREALFDKIVRRRRGGFCYELNGLYAALLLDLGFQVTLLSARVIGDKREPGPEFDHLTLLVTLHDRWLADVGFGEGFDEPLRLDETAPQLREFGNSYRVVREGETWQMSVRPAGGEWRTEYLFDLVPRTLEEFAAMCLHHQTSPASSFTRKRVSTVATATGRVTLSGDRLIVTAAGERREETLADAEAVAEALRDRFGIVLAP